MKINTLEQVRNGIMAALTAASEPKKLNKNADDVLAEAVQNYLSGSNTEASHSATSKPTPGRGRPGIALTHKLQGYSANLRPVSLLMKSGITPGISLRINKSALENATPEVLAALKRLGYDVNQGA